MAQRSGYIGRHPGDGNSAIVRQTYSLTSETTEISFTAGYIVGYVDVYINGVKLIDVQDYEATNASTITLTTAAPSGDVIEVVAYKALSVGSVQKANNDFEVTNNTTLGGTVSVAGTSTLTGVVTTGGDLYVGGDLYGDGSNLSGVGNTEYIDAASVTSSGIVTISNTTSSTSTTTGALIVSGGVGIAGSMFVGENVSIAGTLTYEDVTNIDSVGVVTARLGIIATAGRGVQITAGGLNVDAGIGTFDAGISIPDDQSISLGNDDDLEIHHAAGANSHIKNNTLSLDIRSDTTNINSKNNAVTFVKANASGFMATTGIGSVSTVSSSGEVTVAGGVDINGGLDVAGISTLKQTTVTDLNVSGIATVGGANVGTGATIFSPATNVITAGTASTEVVRINAAAGVLLNNGILVERVKIDSDSINSDKFIRLQDGMVHYRSSAVGAASVKPDIVSNTGINTDLAIGDTIAVTLMTVAGNTSHFVSSVAIDGKHTGITTHWVGGSTPTAGGGSGVDTYSFNILKTASETYTVIANQTLTSS